MFDMQHWQMMVVFYIWGWPFSPLNLFRWQLDPGKSLTFNSLNHMDITSDTTSDSTTFNSLNNHMDTTSDSLQVENKWCINSTRWQNSITQYTIYKVSKYLSQILHFSKICLLWCPTLVFQNPHSSVANNHSFKCNELIVVEKEEHTYSGSNDQISYWEKVNQMMWIFQDYKPRKVWWLKLAGN